jgi:hypothetical protein
LSSNTIQRFLNGSGSIEYLSYSVPYAGTYYIKIYPYSIALKTLTYSLFVTISNPYQNINKTGQFYYTSNKNAIIATNTQTWNSLKYTI